MKKIFLILIFSFVNFAAHAQIVELVTVDLSGKKFDLQQEKGKIILVSFWASWCVNCRKELSVLEEVYQEYKSQGLEIIGINIDHKKRREEVKKISAEFSFPNSLISDAKKISFEEPNFIPLNYVIGKNGEVVAIINGVDGDLTKKDFEKILKPLLSQ